MKHFISPDSIRIDSYTLASKIIADDFKPDFMVAIWRGGAPIGCHVHEYLKYFDIQTDHIAIRTSRYSGIDTANNTVTVHNLGYLIERVTKTSKILLVDDVFDTGLSIAAIFESLSEKLGDNMPVDVRVATTYYKPTRNKTKRVPEYYVHESNEWIVFPHELEGLTIEEIDKTMGTEIGDLIRNTKLTIKS